VQLPEQLLLLNRRPLLLRVAIVGAALLVLGAALAGRRAKTPAEQEIELVARLGRLTRAVRAHDGRRIAPLLDDAFTDAAGRDKPHALAVLTAAGAIPPIGYHPDREVYTLSPDRRSATIKNTVRIFANAPKTRRVTAADVTTITDWVLTRRGWLLYRMHRPIAHAVPLRLPGRTARASTL
jgi:hypothetical protein